MSRRILGRAWPVKTSSCALRSMRARSIGSASTVALSQRLATRLLSGFHAPAPRAHVRPLSRARIVACLGSTRSAVGAFTMLREALSIVLRGRPCPGRRREVSRRSLSAPHARRAALPGAVGRACRRRRSCRPVRMRATPGLGALAGSGVAARSSAVARTAARQRISSLRRSSSSDRCCPDATYRTRGRAYADFVRSGGYGFLDVHRAGERRRARRICATNVLDRVPD